MDQVPSGGCFRAESVLDLIRNVRSLGLTMNGNVRPPAARDWAIVGGAARVTKEWKEPLSTAVRKGDHMRGWANTQQKSEKVVYMLLYLRISQHITVRMYYYAVKKTCETGRTSMSNRQQKDTRIRVVRKRVKDHPLHPTCSIYPKVSSSTVYTSCSRSFYPRREASCS